MSQIERLYHIDRLLNERTVVPLQVFIDKLEVAHATVKRDIQFMRDRLHAPIEWDRERGGYHFGIPDPRAPKYELPGLWFSAGEIHALLTMHQLLSRLGGALLDAQVKPLLARLDELLGSRDHSSREVRQRIRILDMAARVAKVDHFESVADALLKRRRLWIRYYVRSRGQESERVISPQRLVHYRENWYLDAWCHDKDQLRIFSVDSILAVKMQAQKAKQIPDSELDAELAGGYGIFSGKALHRAVLRFTPERARWVQSEQWHPQQKGEIEADGSYRLEVPYSIAHELLMDILKYGPDVEILSPPALRTLACDALAAAISIYKQ